MSKLQGMNRILVTVLVPCRNEERYIAPLLDCILNQDFDLNLCEIILLDGLSNDKTKEIATNYKNNIPNFKLIENKDKTVPFALNKGISIAKGEYIIRMDTHAQYPLNYISTLLYYSKYLKADNVGGVCITVPPISKTKAIAISESISNWFGV